MIGRLMRAVGLVSRAELHLVEEKLRATRQRLADADGRLAQAVAARDELRKAQRHQARQYKTRVAELEARHERAAATAREAGQMAARRIAALEETLRQRSAELMAATREETALERRVADALEELQSAREALASVEVKLNILEGAANMLDRRTRTGPDIRPS